MAIEYLPPRIHVLAKPTGATCNLNCSYCFFLNKKLLYPGSHFRMSDAVLEHYIRQLIESHRTNEVTVHQGSRRIAWRIILRGYGHAKDTKNA